MTERAVERGLPFEIEADGPIVLVHRFRPDLDRYFAYLERELPILRDAIRARIDQRDTKFLFDVRSLDPFYIYPVVKWGAMYGAVAGLVRTVPGEKPATTEEFREAFRLVIAIVVDGPEQRPELRGMGFDQMFGIYERIEQARSVLTEGPGREPSRG
jgi:hypothetical protein